MSFAKRYKSRSAAKNACTIISDQHARCVMRFDIITIFPQIFDSYLNESFLKRAQEKGVVRIVAHDLRDFSKDRHRKVDDKPFGGGPGMVVQIEPVHRAVQFLKSKVKNLRLYRRSILLRRKKSKVRTILFSTRGKKLDARIARRLSKYDQLILICGRYEGVDERVAKYVADEEMSIGEYVVSGGELPALVLIEAVSRFLPGFLGKKESLEEIKGFYPVYTRPAAFLPKKGGRAWRVPPALLSGDHRRIRMWRNARSRT